jgi:hypothetical protein
VSHKEIDPDDEDAANEHGGGGGGGGGGDSSHPGAIEHTLSATNMKSDK